ncbi:MAG: VWA domain-containing protein [Phycisphaerae bacterium]|nr:VWA domain-containing protein [Phycisphaerae bacterium]
MEWITPLTGLFAGGIAISGLVILYFLKLRRTEQMISSTLLWKRAVQDLQVNAPFQRLRRNLLLLLQLLALAVMALALAGPILSLTRGPGKRMVILIDRSASMNATDVSPSRLEEAKRQARVFVESMRNRAAFSLQDSSDQAMVIAFDDQCKVMSNFTADKRQLLAAIDAIEPGDGRSRLAESITVARAFAQSMGEDANNRSSQEPATLVLFSDGQIADRDAVAVGPDEVRFFAIGSVVENVAVTAMQARRSYENPEQVTVFASLANYGAAAVRCDIQIAVNGDVRQVQNHEIPAKKIEGEPPQERPGKLTVEFTLNQAGGAVVEVRHTAKDALDRDNMAWSIISPPKQMRVLLVTEGNAVMESALKACPIQRLEVCTGAQFDAMDAAAMNAQPPYDIIVLDKHNPKSLPKASYIVFGLAPEGIEVKTAAEPLENQPILDWRAQHAILRYVNLTNVFVVKAAKIALPRDAQTLAEFRDSPAIAILRHGGNALLLVAFDILESNWPFEPSFILFWYNALAYLGTQTGEQLTANLLTGEPIVIEGLPAGATGTLTDPEGVGEPISSGQGGIIRYPQTDRAGVYTVELTQQPAKAFALNLLSEEESKIAPVKELTLSSRTVTSADRAMGRANVPLWPWIVLTALVLVCGEWILYNSRIRL